MYERRVKIFIIVSLTLLAVLLLRLAQMQLLADLKLQDEVTRLMEQRNRSERLKTVRGRILDRHGRVLATDVPRFQLRINYQLTCFLDPRVVEARRSKAARDQTGKALEAFEREVATRTARLDDVIDKCTKLDLTEDEVRARIAGINDGIWNLRAFLAWRRHEPDPNLIKGYGSVANVPLSRARTDFERRVPDAKQRRNLTLRVNDIPELHEDHWLLDLESEDDIFIAQFEFMDIDEVAIEPQGYRSYPYGHVAAQTIGWVAPASRDYQKELFEHDRLASYLQGDVCGIRPGTVEYVCEPVLRGRRGERVWDIDRQLVHEVGAEFGQDVVLTLDIDLQQRLEALLTDPAVNPEYYDANMAAVVLDIPSGDILAMVSLPTFDLNRARYDYDELRKHPNNPLVDRCLYKVYQPGSVVKPLVLVAGLESGQITPETVIHCPARSAPGGWPSCWIWIKSHIGHDDQWLNNARNAIRGSCNIYFSHLADDLEPRLLQRWLFAFGYGRKVPIACPGDGSAETPVRRFRQSPGQIGSKNVPSSADILSLDQVPPLRAGEGRLFGIGHGNLRVTPLQVADSFATLARDGRRRPPRLLRGARDDHAAWEDLGISDATLRVVRDGMRAVVEEPGGTAHEAFGPSGLSAQGVRVYGKTGSTEDPENAWFAAFVEDNEGPRVAIALVVEGGLSGTRHGAPLGREVVQACVEAGYVGKAAPTSPLLAP